MIKYPIAFSVIPLWAERRKYFIQSDKERIFLERVDGGTLAVENIDQEGERTCLIKAISTMIEDSAPGMLGLEKAAAINNLLNLIVVKGHSNMDVVENHLNAFEISS